MTYGLNIRTLLCCGFAAMVGFNGLLVQGFAPMHAGPFGGSRATSGSSCMMAAEGLSEVGAVAGIEEPPSAAPVVTAAVVEEPPAPAPVRERKPFAFAFVPAPLDAVRATTAEWLRIVSSNEPDAAVETSRLYADDAVLWGTKSEERRTTPQDILEYFQFFAMLPDLQVSEYTPNARMISDALAINTGFYTFSWQPPNEADRRVQNAQFSFTYKQDPSAKTGWVIVDHHSSLPMHPEA